MKKILSLLGTITLIGTSTTSLVACNKPKIHEYTQNEYTPKELAKLKEENKINTINQEIKDNLEWIAPQEKPFNDIDNKYYFVVWKGKTEWYITKFLNNEKLPSVSSYKILKKEKDAELSLNRYSLDYEVDLYDYEIGIGTASWRTDKGHIFKSVYRWNSDKYVPNLIVNNKTGEVKVDKI